MYLNLSLLLVLTSIAAPVWSNKLFKCVYYFQEQYVLFNLKDVLLAG